MPTGTFEFRDDAERIAIEQAIAFVAQMHDLALSTPPGLVLDRCEGHALDGGRELLRSTLRLAAQAAVDSAEGKKGRLAPARAGAGSASSAAAGGTS